MHISYKISVSYLLKMKINDFIHSLKINQRHWAKTLHETQIQALFVMQPQSHFYLYSSLSSNASSSLIVGILWSMCRYKLWFMNCLSCEGTPEGSRWLYRSSSARLTTGTSDLTLSTRSTASPARPSHQQSGTNAERNQGPRGVTGPKENMRAV